MSKYNNVNPGQYKLAGRERPDDIARERMKGSRSEAARGSERSQRAKTTSRSKTSRAKTAKSSRSR
jgi:hypothetical protein